MPSAVSFPTKMVIFLLAVLSAGGSASAQVSDPTGAEEARQREQREEEARKRREKTPDVRTERPAVEPFALPEESPCFQIQTVSLEGDEGDRLGIGKYAEEYAGRCIGRDGLGVIVGRLTSVILAKGYVTTRIGIPEQDLSSGRLRLVVIPGTIREIRFSEDVRGTWKTAFPMGPGDLVNVRDLDQGVEQWKRVPTQDVEVKLVPAGDAGHSDIVLQVKRRFPLRAGLTFDNSGSKSTGKLQGTGSLSLDNPAGLSDLLSLSYGHDLAARQSVHGTWNSSLWYSVPYGYWTGELSVNASGYHQTVSGGTQSFRYSGRTYGFSLGAERVVHRDQRSKTSFSAKLTKGWSKTKLDDVEIRTQRRNVTTGELWGRHRRFFGRTVLEAGLGYRKGLPLFAESDPAGKVTTRYDMGLADLSFTAPFELLLPLRASLSGRAQFSPDRLLSADQFGIGSPQAVRGFDGETMLTSERGFLVRSELGVPIEPTSQIVYAGLDYGHVYGPTSRTLAGRELAGTVIGVRGSHRFASYELSMGLPISKPKGFRTAIPVFTFRLTGQL